MPPFDYSGTNLVFLISQPRAGSTLLQSILASHPDVGSASEPWLMFAPYYALRSKGSSAEYNVGVAHKALRRFLESDLPAGHEDYLEGVRRMYGYLYERARTKLRTRYFLDKTPRYYFVIKDLWETFPNAKFLLLFRNPLHVLVSMINTWGKNNWFGLYQYRDDLLRAPDLLASAVDLLGDSACVCRYESLVQHPQAEVTKICDFLDLERVERLEQYGRESAPTWAMGDASVQLRSSPEFGHDARFEESIKDPQMHRLCVEYLDILDPETMLMLGYSKETQADQLEKKLIRRRNFGHTMSLDWLLRKHRSERTRVECIYLKVVQKIQDL